MRLTDRQMMALKEVANGMTTVYWGAEMKALARRGLVEQGAAVAVHGCYNAKVTPAGFLAVK